MGDHTFCRSRLASVMQEVKKYTTPAQRKKSWAWTFDRKQGEFHGPDGYYVDGLSGCCIWMAKAEGWAKWLEVFGSDEVKS